ncbi:MAG: DUF1080 domain-containing protein [Planctomycetota bacterium]
MTRSFFLLLFVTPLTAGFSCDLLPTPSEPPTFEPLFDGNSLAGWEGDTRFFRVEDGALIAGRLDSPIPRNEFLASKESFGDFDLRFEARLLGTGRNAGVPFRSERVAGRREMIGYQCDIGKGALASSGACSMTSHAAQECSTSPNGSPCSRR